MNRVPIRALVVGDRFISADTFAEAMTAAAQAHDLPLALERLDLHYPALDQLPLPPSVPPTPFRPLWEDPEVVVARAAEDAAADPTINEYSGPVDLLLPYLDEVDALVVHLAPVSQNAIANAAHLRAIGCARGGPTNINMTRLNDRGIPLFNCPGRNARAVAEYILGAVLSHTRGIASGAATTKAGRWQLDLYSYDRVGSELHGKTCGLIGFGGVGGAFAPIAKGIGLNLLVHDPYVDPDTVREAGGKTATLDDVLSTADLVVLAARLTPETRGMIGSRELGLMRPDAIFVNAARAELVDGAALRDVLGRRAIAGAVIDVFSPEPLTADDPLLSMDHVLLTPHIAGASKEAAMRGAEVACRHLVGYLATGSLDGCFNRQAVAAAQATGGRSSGGKR